MNDEMRKHALRRYLVLRVKIIEFFDLGSLGQNFSCCGAVLDLLLAMAGRRGLAHLNAFNLPLLESVRVDGSTPAFTLLAAVASGVLLGLAPALQVPAYKLREGMQGRTLRDSHRCLHRSGFTR